MKTKHILLAIAAAVVAVTAAFASVRAPHQVHLRAIMTQGEEYECIQCGVQCDDAGSAVCQVIVDLRGGGSVIAKSTGPIYTYKAGCTTVLRHTIDELQHCTLTGNNRPLSLP